MDRTQKKREEIQKKQQVDYNQMPMNKDFLKAENPDGTFKYPIAQKIWAYKIIMMEELQDLMRQCAAYIAQLKHHQNRIVRLQQQYDSVVKERDEAGRLFSKEEIQLKIMSEKMAIPRDIAKLRLLLTNDMLPKIDGLNFTGEKYNDFVMKAESRLKQLGYELFPEKLEVVDIPEL